MEQKPLTRHRQVVKRNLAALLEPAKIKSLRSGEQSLTYLESEIIYGLLMGDDAQDVAAKMGYSSATASETMRRVRHRFFANSNEHLAVILTRLGFIEDDFNVRQYVPGD